MKRIWMFLAAGAFSLGLLTSQAVAKDLDRINEPLDRLEEMDKQRGVHVDLPANVGAGANGIQGLQNNRGLLNPGAQGLQNRAIQNRAIQNRAIQNQVIGNGGIQNRPVAPVQAAPNQPATQAPVPDAPFSNFPHAPGVDHG
jgi:hypothetical protein